MKVRLLLAAAALLLAPILALQAQAASNGSLPAWAESWNGFRVADEALSRVTSTGEGSEKSLKVGDEAIAAAYLAYKKEPFATDALFLLSGEVESDQVRFLGAARELDKRNRLTVLALLQTRAQANDLPKVLPLVDQLSRLDPELAPQFVSILSQSLSDPQAVDVLKQALQERPVWAAPFWRRVPSDPAALSRFLSLRNEVSPIVDAQADRNLLTALVKGERFQDAFTIYAELRAAGDQSGERYPPLDWQFTQTRDLRGAETDDGLIEAFVYRGTSGEIARKLVEIKPGEYRVAGELITNGGTGTISAELRCADGADDPSWQTQTLGEKAGTWNVSEGACRYAWLVLDASAWESSVNFEASIRNLEFQKL